MANVNEIKARINGVNSTKKITRAMYMISASKSQKAKKQLEDTYPYFRQVLSAMIGILQNAEVLDTPYIRSAEADEGEAGALGRNATANLYVVMGGDKGMAGGYGHNILTLLEEHVDKEADDVLAAGANGRAQMKQQGYRVDAGFVVPVMNPSICRARDVAELVAEKYLTGQYKGIYVVYTEMVSSLKQEPAMLQLLPLEPEALCEIGTPPERCSEIEYLPSAREVFDRLATHYLKGILYSAFVKAFASEQHARMFAMDSATKNADETIAKLSLQYNRARQAKITQELSEIVGGIPQGKH